MFGNFGGDEFRKSGRQARGRPKYDVAALDEVLHGRNPEVWLWRDWPAEYQDPHSPAVREFAIEHSREVLFYKFLQWHIDLQLTAVQAYAIEKGMRIGLYHDLALATDRYGADLWANRTAALMELGRLGEALESCDRAFASMAEGGCPSWPKKP